MNSQPYMQDINNIGNQWFLIVSENESIGPFEDIYDLQLASFYYREEHHWPSAAELRHFLVRAKTSNASVQQWL